MAIAHAFPKFVKVDAAMEHEPREAGTRPLALTLGEPAGIGPDITLAAWLRRDELKLPSFYVLGDAGFLEKRARALGLKVPLAEIDADKAGAAFSTALPERNTSPEGAAATPGEATRMRE